jgi:hypothetical protein
MSRPALDTARVAIPAVTTPRWRLDSDTRRGPSHARMPEAAPTVVAAAATHCMHIVFEYANLRVVIRASKLLPALAATAAVVLSGCGAAYDDAQSFVEAANAEGAGFELGPTLSSTNPDLEIYALEVEGAAHAAEAREEGQAHLGGGSLTVTPSDDDAKLEYDECENAVSLICYRAGNVALALEGEIEPEEKERVDAAISALGSD